MRFLLSALIPFTVQDADITGKVLGVTDGENVAVLDAENQQH